MIGGNAFSLPGQKRELPRIPLWLSQGSSGICWSDVARYGTVFLLRWAMLLLRRPDKALCLLFGRTVSVCYRKRA